MSKRGKKGEREGMEEKTRNEGKQEQDNSKGQFVYR